MILVLTNQLSSLDVLQGLDISCKLIVFKAIN